MDMGEKIFQEGGALDSRGPTGRHEGADGEVPAVSAANAAKFAGKRHLMLFVTDPATGEGPHAGVAGKVDRHGPRQGVFLEGHLVVMGEHIGADVACRTPGKYTFKAEIESGAKKGSATFSYTLK